MLFGFFCRGWGDNRNENPAFLLESSTNASACHRRWDRTQRPRRVRHPQIVSSRSQPLRPLPIAAEMLDSGWRLSQSHGLPSTSRVERQSCPRLPLRHESTPSGSFNQAVTAPTGIVVACTWSIDFGLNAVSASFVTTYSA